MEHRRLGLVLLVTLSLLGSAAAWAGPAAASAGGDALAVPVAGEPLSVVGRAWYLEDPDGSLSLEDVRSRADGWQPFVKERPNLGFVASAYWVRFELRNDTGHHADSMLVFTYPLLDYVDAYLEQPDGAFQRVRTGDLLPFDARPVANEKLAIPVLTPAGHHQSVFLRVESQSSMQFGFQVMSRDRFIRDASRGTLFRGIYYGIMAVMVLYNLFLYLAIRNTSYLLYVCFVAPFAFSQLGLDGTAGAYVFPHWPGFANTLLPLSIAIANPFPVLFAQHFLDTKRFFPRVHRFLLGYVTFAFACIPLALIAPYAISIRVFAGFAILTPLILEVIGIMVLRKGYRPARFFVLAWTALIVGTILFAVTSFGLLPPNFLTINVQQIGSALEVTLLSFALGDRIKLIEREREQAMAETLALEKDMALTAAVQQLFLPKEDVFETRGVALAGFYRPATRCGGDWWWHERLDDERVLVLLGDVTGHGAGAAMMTAAMATAYRAIPPEQRVGEVQALLHQVAQSFQTISGGTHHMALTAVEIDLRADEVHCWSAGAPAVLVLRADGSVEGLGARGRPIGHDKTSLGYASCQLRPGDRLFVFSDGLPELIKPNGRQLGYRGIQRVLASTSGRDLREARDLVSEALDAQRMDEPQYDDMTFVIIDIRHDEPQARAA